MSLTAQNLVDRAASVLNDASFTRWASAELLNWLNDGRRELTKYRPDVYATTAAVSAVAGAKQSIPTAGVKFLSAPRQTNKGAITLTDKTILDRFCPDWIHGYYHTTPLHYSPHESEPRAFWVYPPLRQGISLDVVYLPTITDLALSGTLAATEEPYAAPLVDYICYRAISKDVEFAGNTARAAAHYQAFVTAVGGQPA